MDTRGLTEQLKDALGKHDYALAAESAGSIAAALRLGEPISDQDRQAVLDQLRKKRIFGPLVEVAKALESAGPADARVRRQLAQARIEQGQLNEAERLLRSIVGDPGAPAEEHAEATGLLGRVDKQRYVNGGLDEATASDALSNALNTYLKGYQQNPPNNYWHGINAVSLAERAVRDGIRLTGLPEEAQEVDYFAQMAKDILERIEAKDSPDVWELATAAEAAVALNRFDAAQDWIEKYTAQKGADVFELSSTTRQFVEVLQLDERPEGAPLLDRLRAENLKRSGGGFIPLVLEAAQSSAERAGTPASEPVRVPILLRVSDPSWQPDHIPDLIVTSRLGLVIAALGSQRSIDAALQDPQVVGMEASRAGGAYETSGAPGEPGSAQVAAGPAAPSGNVIVAIIDSGVDILHEAFLDANGKSRIIAYWDQADPTGPEPLPKCGGTSYDETGIASFVEKKQLPPGVVTADLSHGTHVASIAAGRACGAFGGGVAPDARIIVVRSKTTAEPSDPRAVGYSVAHTNALTFIDKIAKERGMPVVVNVSQGQNAGAHDGKSLLELAFDEFAGGGRKAGRVVVKSAGNEREKNLHAKVSMQPDSEEELRFRLLAARVEAVFMELWFGPGSTLKFELRGPQGNPSPAASLEQLEVSGQLSGGNRVRLSYDRFHRDNGDSRLRIMIERGSAAAIAQGDWTLTITSLSSVDGSIHAWLERGLVDDVGFLNHIDEEMTLSVPGTAITVITVAAIEMKNGVRKVGPFSCYGKTRDGREKPNICAPGVNVVAARAGTATGVVQMSGTSMAAPHVTGAIALVLSSKAYLDANQFQSRLRISADPGKVHDRGQGYGLLDLPKLMALP